MKKWLITLSLMLACMAGRVEAQVKMLEVVTFGGGNNWPVWIATDQGFFAKNNLTVNLTLTPGSVQLMQNLVGGKFDIALAAIDNLVAYMEGQGEAQLPAEPDLVAVFGSQSGTMRLVALPEIKSYADLKGKDIGLDAKTTGFAFVLMKMLEHGGLKPQDVNLVPAGGTPFHVQALLDKKIAATVVYSPFEVTLMEKGYSNIGDGIDAFGKIQGISGFVQRSWAKQRPEDLTGFIRAWIEAIDFIYDPKNKEAAIAILQKNAKLTPEQADASYKLMLGDKEGFQKKGKIDLEGIRTVLKLRSEYGTPKKELSDPAKYVDETWYQQALAGSR
jgi:ABC-type nitrate/sulfonate/bicarbonate transport system substrate-binding protein